MIKINESIIKMIKDTKSFLFRKIIKNLYITLLAIKK